MKRAWTVVLALAFVGFVACGAYAAGTQAASETGSGMVAAGSERIAVMGAAHYADVAGDAHAYASLFAVAAEYGYMVCDQFEMAARGMIALVQAGAAGTTTRVQLYTIVFIPKWRIPVEGNISPYIGPKAGAAYAHVGGVGKVGGTNVNGNQAVFIWGAVAGADIFLSKQTSLFAEYDFTYFKIGGDSLGGGSLRIRDQGITAGLAYWW